MSKYDVKESRRFCEENMFRNLDNFRSVELFEDLSNIDRDMPRLICRDILNGDPNNSPLENMEDFFNQQALPDDAPEAPHIQGNGFGYNSYPFGDVSNNLYNRFLGICWPKTKLNDVLKAALVWAEEIKKHNDPDEFKDSLDIPPYEHAAAFILTYKWDAVAFRKLEERFLEYAACGIWFVFILVTDYGCVQIPFLPNNRNLIIEVPRYEGEEEQFKSLIYTVSNDSLLYESKSIFDLTNKTWSVVITRNGHSNIDYGTIAPRRIKLFNAYMKRIDLNKIGDKLSFAMDDLRYSLIIDGKEIKWDSLAEGIYPYSHLEDAVLLLLEPVPGNGE